MSASAAAGGWTDLLRPAGPAAPAARVLVFPHAGAGPLRYRAPLSRLSDDVELVGVTLPGRGRRVVEPLSTCAAEAAEGVLRELRRLPPAPTVLYGHSMGGLLAVAVADLAGDDPAAVNCGAVVVSCAPPGARTPLPLEDILAMHGLPRGALRECEGRSDRGDSGDATGFDWDARVLAHDLSLSLQALTAVRGARLTVPLTALAGHDDQLVPAEDVPRWAAFTQAAYRQRLVAGGHFFPFAPSGTDVLLAELDAALHAAVTSGCRPAAPRV
ncbi:alpha/beta fold hydrolase [Streptomyces sp. NPDC051776]|uniref:thioesterase II family protein n=1 Tax=Streptomyces sp. NPDC051776 TaxID=3155414 RepID=UPI003440BD57